MVISPSGKVIGVVSCAHSVELTLPNALVSGCIRREADEQLSNVHHGRCFPDVLKGLWCDRPCMSTRHRPNDPDIAESIRTNRPPGALADMIYMSPATTSGVGCADALPQHPMRVVYNSGVVLVFLCRLVSASLPKGIFWLLMGTGTAQCALAHPCDSPLRGVEDLPR